MTPFHECGYILINSIENANLAFTCLNTKLTRILFSVVRKKHLNVFSAAGSEAHPSGASFTLTCCHISLCTEEDNIHGRLFVSALIAGQLWEHKLFDYNSDCETLWDYVVDYLA